MRRSFAHAAAVFACALATTGCASLGLEDSAAMASPQAAKPAGDPSSGPLAEVANKLPDNLDGEIRRAQLLRASGDFGGATRSLSQLMLVAPDDPRVVGEYGKVLAQEGDTDDALAFLKRAIELQADNWTFYSALGVAYDQRAERGKAEDAYKHALALKPDEPTVLNNYAVSRMLAGDLDRAESLLRQAAAHGGDFPKIANNLAMIADKRAKRGMASGPESALKPAIAVARASLPASRPVQKRAQSGAPRALHPALNTVAANAPKKAAARVVMQAVPYDPLAGKVYGRYAMHPAARLASAEPKAAEKPQAVARADSKAVPHTDGTKPSAPTLRTASDIY